MGQKKSVNIALENMFDRLEKHGYIVTKTNAKGEKELQKVVDTIL